MRDASTSPVVRQALDAAWRICGHGVDSLTTREIAKVARVPRGSLQRYLPRKRDLVSAVATRAVDEATSPATAADATAWARVWIALRTEAARDEELRARLDAVTEIHRTRRTAVDDLLFKRRDR